MINPQQSGSFKWPKNVEPPKVKNGGAYKFPPKGPTKEEQDLVAAKAELLRAKAAKINRQNQPSYRFGRKSVVIR
jgi:hypothetical protein